MTPLTISWTIRSIDMRSGIAHPGIKQEADGSTILYLQSTSPGADKESNWLPTPKQGAFSLALRTYGSGEGIVKQPWQPPTVKKVP